MRTPYRYPVNVRYSGLTHVVVAQVTRVIVAPSVAAHMAVPFLFFCYLASLLIIAQATTQIIYLLFIFDT